MRMFVAVALAGAMLLAVGSDPRLARAQEKKDENQEKMDKLIKEIEDAAKARDYKKVIELAKAAAKLDEKNPGVHFALGTAHLSLRQNAEAVKALTEVIKLEPKFAPAYDRRGDANLKLGKFKEAVADFDAYLKERPKDGPDHWRRGIALYYAGKYEDGVKQFESHKTVNPEDVENAVWHYLCNVRATKNKEKAQKDLIPIKDDNRVPMKEVWKLFKGEIKPDDVLKVIDPAKMKGEALKEAQFYAHLYVALYYESEGDAAKCKEHLKTAVETYKIGHYMWDVGAAHLKVLEDKK